MERNKKKLINMRKKALSNLATSSDRDLNDPSSWDTSKYVRSVLPDNCSIVQKIKINGALLSACVDSGATNTIIPKSIADKINIKIDSACSAIILADGNSSMTRGKAYVKIEQARKICWLSVTLLEVAPQILLENDFCKKMDLFLCWQNRAIMLADDYLKKYGLKRIKDMIKKGVFSKEDVLQQLEIKAKVDD
jgi:retroviral aspartyl protease